MTLHPQSAVEHLQRASPPPAARAATARSIIEAAEIVVSRARPWRPSPVRPAEPLAGMPDRSPDPARRLRRRRRRGGPGRRPPGARRRGRRRSAASSSASRTPCRAGAPAPRRVTPLSARREMQRRAAVAILVVRRRRRRSLGAGVSRCSAAGRRRAAIASAEVGQQAARGLPGATSTAVIGPGIDLVANDPKTGRATSSPTRSPSSTTASNGGIADQRRSSPIRVKIVADLDRLYKMRRRHRRRRCSPSRPTPGVDLRAIVHGPDGAPYVLDAQDRRRSTGSTSPTRRRSSIFRAGNKPPGATEAAPV